MKALLLVTAFLMVPTGFIYAQGTQAAGGPFAVVELFESEGCSDCPPADDLLRQITASARSNGAHVYTLDFEVDYWNSSAWQDPFSSPLFSERQQRYAGVLPGGVYTPEMVINGQEAFVGSDEEKAHQFIDHYLSVPVQNSISLDLDQTGSDLKVNYAVAAQDAHAVINFALVERGLESQVTDGENGGRSLKHDNIVRELKTVYFNDLKGTVTFSKLQEKDLTRFSVIAFLQSSRNMSILAASEADLK